MQVLCWYQNDEEVEKIRNQFQTSIWRQTLSISTVGTPLQRILQTRRRFQCECINSNMLCVNPSLPTPSNQNQTTLTQSNPSHSTIHSISIYSKKYSRMTCAILHLHEIFISSKVLNKVLQSQPKPLYSNFYVLRTEYTAATEAALTYEALTLTSIKHDIDS